MVDGEADNFYCAVPRARAECVFGDKVPVYGEYFTLVLVPRGYWEFVHPNVEKLDGAISRGYCELVFMRFRPGDVVERVLGVEPEGVRLQMRIWIWICSGGNYHFSATIPLGVRPRICRRPLPTRPKFADEATAMRESKKGEYFTA